LASLPVRYAPPEATYLAWLDWPELPRDAYGFFRAAGVELSAGPEFGGGPSQVRLNFATSAEVLEKVLNRMAAAVGG
jgi:cystathionine beta-lyase